MLPVFSLTKCRLIEIDLPNSNFLKNNDLKIAGGVRAYQTSLLRTTCWVSFSRIEMVEINLRFQEWLRTIASTLKWSFHMFRRSTECAMTCSQRLSTRQTTNQPQPTNTYLCRPMLTFLQMIYKVYSIVYKIKTFSRNFHV